MVSGPRPVMSASPRRMVPLVGGRSPESRLVSVDLPAPLGPMTAWMRPRQRSTETSLTAARPPKRLVRCVAESRISSAIGVVLAAAGPRHEAEDAARGERHDGNDEQAHPQLPVFPGVEGADGGQVLEPVQQPLEGERPDRRPG